MQRLATEPLFFCFGKCGQCLGMLLLLLQGYPLVEPGRTMQRAQCLGGGKTALGLPQRAPIEVVGPQIQKRPPAAHGVGGRLEVDFFCCIAPGGMVVAQ